MINFFKILLSGSNEVSSRRFIAVLTLPFYLMSICVGVFHDDFRYFVASLIASSLPIMLAFYRLKWKDLTDLLNTKAFKKGSDGFDFTQDQLQDP